MMNRAALTLFPLLLLLVPSLHADKKPSPQRGDQPRAEAMQMNPGIARAVVHDLLRRRYLPNIPSRLLIPGATFFETKSVDVTRQAVNYDYEVAYSNKQVTLRHAIVFREQKNYLEAYSNQYASICRSGSDSFWMVFRPGFATVASACVLTWKDEKDAQRFADAVNRLIYEAYAAQSSSDDELGQFMLRARTWLEKPETRPVPPVALDRHRILAEQSLKERDITGALLHYEEGVALDPTWAEGWFNAALLYEALNEFEYASNRMKHYLALAPEASDAQAAREKVIIWDDKARRR